MPMWTIFNLVRLAAHLFLPLAVYALSISTHRLGMGIKVMVLGSTYPALGWSGAVLVPEDAKPARAAGHLAVNGQDDEVHQVRFTLMTPPP